jgi:site-specific DNA-cytosine methylase
MDPRRPSKTMVSHMSKDTYAFVHPFSDRTISVREAARIQGFPDWFSFGEASLTEAFKMIGNAVPPFLSHELASRLAAALTRLHRPELKIVVQTAGRN